MPNYVPQLGTAPTSADTRDAVHIAVVPAIAQTPLAPATPVALTLIRDQLYTTLQTPHVGIIDPYLTQPAMPGSSVWVCLYPNTITDLRHHWTHPRIPDISAALVTPEQKRQSYLWIEHFAREGGAELDDLLRAAGEVDETGDVLDYYTTDGETLQNFDEGLWQMFWYHYGILNDLTPKHPDRAIFFSCSC